MGETKFVSVYFSKFLSGKKCLYFYFYWFKNLINLTPPSFPISATLLIDTSFGSFSDYQYDLTEKSPRMDVQQNFLRTTIVLMKYKIKNKNKI